MRVPKRRAPAKAGAAEPKKRSAKTKAAPSQTTSADAEAPLEPNPVESVTAESVASVESIESVASVESDKPNGPAADGMMSLEGAIEFVLRAIVSNQEALTIVRCDEPDKIRISVAVAPEDLGKVIGKQGRTINALRTVIKTQAASTNTQVVVDLEGKPD